MEEERYAVPFLFVFSVLLYIPFLGSRDLWAPVEPRYGEIVRVMFSKGEWIVPNVNGDLYTDKPILYFWLALGFSYLNGAVSEWTVRLPSALSAIGLVLATYLLGKTAFDRRTGFFAALVLGTTVRAVWEARWAHTDMLFTFLFACTMLLFFRMSRGEGRTVTALAAYSFMGLAVLAKGLIGIVLPGLILGPLLVLTEDIKRLRRFHPIFGTAVVLLVVSAWFIPVSLATEGRWIKEFVWTHHIQRYVAGAGHEEPFYYYLINFPLDFLPWTLFLAPAAMAYWPEKKHWRDPSLLFFSLWFLAVFVFFSISSTKRGLYLLPLYPPAALFVASYIVSWERGGRRGGNTLRLSVYIFFAVLFIASVALPFVALHLRPEMFRPSMPFAIVNALGAFFVLRRVAQNNVSSAALWIVGAVVAGILCSSAWILPVIDTYKSPRVFASEIKQQVSPADPLYIYADRMNDFNYYLERDAIPVMSQLIELSRIAEQQTVAYVLIREKDYRRIPSASSDWEIALKGSAGSKEWVLLESRKERRPSP